MASAATLLLSFTLPITASYAQGQGASLSSATASQSVTQASESVVKAFAPSGTLRASINLGNPVLASIDPAAGKPVGVSVDLATELARRLGVPLQLVVVKSAGASVDNVNQDKADVGFFAVDPKRGQEISFTKPYVLIEGFYLVHDTSPITTNEQVDQPGVTVAVGKDSAYDLFLTRELQRLCGFRPPQPWCKVFWISIWTWRRVSSSSLRETPRKQVD
jgi:polar amino acid transport system substrate-binding protein